MIEVIRKGRHIGAEIRGVDLAKPLDEATFRAVEAAFNEHAVVYFRDQKLTPQSQVDFSRRFGPLDPHVRAEHRLKGFPEILVLSNMLDESGRAIGSQDAGRMWHSDQSYKREPSRATMLFALEIPMENGKARGNTWFSSTAAAFDALPAEMQRRLEGMRNVHSYADYRAKNRVKQIEDEARGGRKIEEHALDAERLKAVPDVDMPVVRVHPWTGRKCLFVNEAHTSCLTGVAREESDRLLGELYAHMLKPEFLYCHEWQAGDLLMWDNCTVQHKATFDYDLPLRRHMLRTTVRGPAVV